jgi:hypothetical protein
MIVKTSLEIAEYAKKHNWLLIEQSSKEDLDIGDDYFVYITPQGREVIINFSGDGSIHKIITK